jgi:hypothetical protein
MSQPDDGAADREGTLEEVSVDDVPSLAEAIVDAYDWCMKNREALAKLREAEG